MAKKPKIQGGAKGVRAHFLDALKEMEETKPPADHPDPNLPRGDIKPGQWPGFPSNAMPPDCPVQVLGMKGQAVYAISAVGQLHEITRWDHPTMVQLFAPFTNYLLWAFPAFGKAKKDSDGNVIEPPRVERLARDKCVEALVTEAGRRGIFDPAENVRGRGGWRTDDERMIWHSGRYLWTVEKKTNRDDRAVDWQLQCSKPGEFDGYFYKQDAAIMEPWMEPVDVMESPAHQLLMDLKTWNWSRPQLDPVFLLGWIGASLMGAALDVRPILFTTGGAGVGKSTLHNIIRALFSSTLYSSANTTAAGIYQNIGQDSRPVAIDEFEAKAGSQREQQIIELARQAYSGAKLYRGGANHEGVEFELRNAFLFSSILHPPLSVQDKTRMAILNLRALDKGHGRAPVIKDVAGRMLLRQVMDGYHDFNNHILPRWKTLLNKVGFDARAIDTYGTLLAAAELLVGRMGLTDVAKLPVDNDEAIIELMRDATAAEMAAMTPKWQEVVDRLMSTTIDQYKQGDKRTVGKTIELLENEAIDIREARDSLAMVGLGLRDKRQPLEGYGLAVPINEPKLDQLFANTDYNKGVWTQALRQAPETVVPPGLEKKHYTVKINRVAKFCTIVDLAGYDLVTGAAEAD